MSSPARQMKDSVYAQLARIGKALAAPARLELLDLLSQGPRTVEALAQQAALTVANASRHLQVLRAARLVEATKRGAHVEYRLADDAVAGFYLALRGVAETRLAEVAQLTRAYLTERGALEELGGDELLRRVRRGEVTVLDVRPADEFHAGHPAGRVGRPRAGELKAARLAEVPRDRARGGLLPRPVLRDGDRGGRAVAQEAATPRTGWSTASPTGGPGAGRVTREEAA
jgi:DNA-binding transcriptional ArsR family regulator